VYLTLDGRAKMEAGLVGAVLWSVTEYLTGRTETDGQTLDQWFAYCYRHSQLWSQPVYINNKMCATSFDRQIFATIKVTAAEYETVPAHRNHTHTHES